MTGYKSFVVSVSAFSTSGSMPSGPSVLPLFMLLIASKQVVQYNGMGCARVVEVTLQIMDFKGSGRTSRPLVNEKVFLLSLAIQLGIGCI